MKPVALLLAALPAVMGGWGFGNSRTSDPVVPGDGGLSATVEVAAPATLASDPPTERPHLAGAAAERDGARARTGADGGDARGPGGDDATEPLEPPEPVGPIAAAPRDSLPFEVRLVDAETGRLAPATWTLVPSSTVRHPDRLPPETLPVKDARIAAALLVVPGPSAIAWDSPWAEQPVSRYAERAAVTYPLRREITAHVRVATSHGRSPVGTLDVETWSAGRRVTAPWREASRTPPDAPGHACLEVPGIALLHGEPFEIGVRETRSEQTFSAGFAGTLGRDARTPLDVDFVLPAVPDASCPYDGPATNGLLAFGGAFGGRGCGHPRVRDAPQETGALALDVTRTDGRPAAGARVVVTPRRAPSRGRIERRLDADGHVRIVALPVGVYDVELCEVGLVPTTREACVVAGPATHVVLGEAPGASLHVEVTDEAGHPLPFAGVEVFRTSSGVAWVDLVRDVQRLDGFTDERGCRLLPRLGPGPTGLRARYGSRRAEETVDVPPSGIVPVRLIVR